MKRILLATLIVILTATVVHARMVSVAGRKINMRSGPGATYAVLWQLGQGYPLQVIETKGKWLKVTDFEGDVGWVHNNLLGREPHLIVKKERIDIRNGPGENYKITGKANYGVVFRTLTRKKGWVKIKHEDGLEGWVQRDLLWGW